MNEEFNCCEYIRNCHKDPTKIQPRIKVIQMIQLQQHVQTCQECSDLVDDVLSNAPKKEFPDRGEN